MPCPRCGSNNMWDDNLWEGCNDCGYASGPDGPTFILAKDKPGLARSVDEMRNRGQVTSPSFGIRIVPDQTNRAWEKEDNDEPE